MSLAQSPEAPARPSWSWSVLAAIISIVAVTFVVLAVAHERSASRPVGEGELFAIDGEDARSRFESMTNEYGLSEGVRHLRNDLMIEAVSVVDSDGSIIDSTSENLLGTSIDNPVLMYGLGSSQLSAVARAIDQPVLIDGVVEWSPGQVLYEVTQPLSRGALLLSYDMTALLERRQQPAGIEPATLQLLGAATGMLLISLALLVGRGRVLRTNRERFHEARLLHDHNRELGVTNRELQKAREAAVDALALAEERNRIRSEFVLMINHELRTPLTAMVTGAELLNSNERLPEDDRDALMDDMVADGRRLEALIAQMLEVARIENKGLNLSFASHTESEICEQVASAHPRISHIHAAGDAAVWTNSTTLVQLIGSLADNAITHGATSVTLTCSATLPITPDVQVGTMPEDGIHFAVSDDGPGIDPEFLPRIFEKFEKRSFSSGTGLGLYLATMMAEALNACVSVSTSPRGTTFVVSIPPSSDAVLREAA